MALPTVATKTKKVRLSDGSTVTVRGLTRAQALAMAELDEDAAKIEPALLAAGTGSAPEEAQKFYDTAPFADTQKLVEAIMALSGLDGELGNGRRGA
jgi:hypothetical protein